MTTLSEAESKALLASHGVPVLTERLVATPDEAVAAADELGYPVVAKLCGDAIAHKTERGLVRLGLGDAAAVRGRPPPSCSPPAGPRTGSPACWSPRWCRATGS